MLTWTSDRYGVSFSVKFDRWDDDRVQYAWTIAVRDPQNLTTACDAQWTGADLRSGSGADVDEPDMLRTLASFFAAWCESHEYAFRTGRPGENVDLFPSAMIDAIDVGTWSDIADDFASSVDR